jgi:MoaA/NifB/PqqE/SkfB family radical SAM enzyme
MFSLTGKCNLRCDHCPRGVLEVYAHQTPNEIIDYVICNILPQVRSVRLGGTDLGEQLTSSNFNRFLEAILATPPKHLEIVSNLTVLDEPRADLIARACTDFRISLEGVGAAYERVRHFPWAKIERHLELLRLARMKHAASPLRVACLVTCFRDNLHDLEAILDLDRLGVAQFQFRLFQANIPEQASQALDYHRSEANAVFDRIRAIADARHLQVSLPPRFEIASLVPTAKPAPESPTTRTLDFWVCHFPFETVSVLSDGQVSPCCEPMYLGQLDLQKPDLTAVFRSEPWQNLRRSLATGEFSGRCVTCELRKSREIEMEKLDLPTL